MNVPRIAGRLGSRPQATLPGGSRSHCSTPLRKAAAQLPVKGALARILFPSLACLLLSFPVQAQNAGGQSDSKPTLGKIFEEDRMFIRKAFSASVRAAGLVETLNQDGPFTVFVFTNRAAQALKGEFPNPGDDPAFRKLMQYHVVPGRKVMASDFLEVDELETLEGSTIEVDTKGGTTVLAEGGEGGERTSKQPKTIVLKGKNRVEIGPDPALRDLTNGSNGVIHVVKSVLRVPEK